MEHAGERVSSLFPSSNNGTSVSRIADIFAGYVHTLLAANEGNESVFVLHRDISENNLMVRDGKTPFVIDWGCGVVAPKNWSRMTSVNSMVGTAVFMSLRILKQLGKRSFLDDLESLFLAFAYNVWKRYGTETSLYRSLWDSNDGIDNVIISRCYWLVSEQNFITEMKLVDCPSKLERLAVDLYKFIFPAGIRIHELVLKDCDDPRLGMVDTTDLFTIFKAAATSSTDSAADSEDTTKHVNALGEYVSKVVQPNKRKTGDDNQEPSVSAIRRDAGSFSSSGPRSKRQRGH
ncbi:hypothetical protein EV175_005216 [Coemansia sp. RSA 1933]|nr:hypothetical protein EV175_005216 [Coemansia sp. RSA 1933]